MKKYLLPLLLIVAAWGATQCTDENAPSKQKAKLEITVPDTGFGDLTSGTITRIPIKSGTGDYDIEVSDPEAIDVRLSEDKKTLLVRAKNGGTADVTITDRATGQKKTFTLNVVKKVVKVTTVLMQTANNTKVQAGDNFQMAVDIKPANADNKAVNWQSSDPSIATVDENGKVTAIKNGSVTITATTVD